MNDNPSPRDEDEPAGAGVPAAVERELPPGRHRVLREQLMREIENGGDTPVVRPRTALWRRPAFVGPAVAAALTVAVVVGAAVTQQVAVPLTTHADGSGDRRLGEAKRSDQRAAELLERVAEAAGRRSLPKVRDDQFVYTERDDYHWKMDSEKTDMPCPMTLEGYPYGLREIWWSVDGQHNGLSRERPDGGEVTEISIGRQLPVKNGVNFFREGEEELPTDADGMYRYLYGLKGDERASGAKSADRKAFDKASTLLAEQLLPPKVEAALYRALARIPGLTVYEGSVDAAGRTGISVGLTGNWPEDRGHGRTRHELLFDTRTSAFLAADTVKLDPPADSCDTLAAGDLVLSVAILERAVVDSVSERP
ncbi:CU044_5270 family protein [Streptomyces caniscabiei]|uniref:CU044_5270 family protein n=1 Tax=Streptomyces caniscabiei TaxID=2746961 RepID=A0A927L7K8_9ACTN|nr:CU044_5270 family protein [Streptomyces caniscabiei]MBD9703092.1 CU044_5270 family protein [Streptomyces caniscabiei]MBD9727576.1 CU044_5270 family protein [Streptomyces caniscabiei]MDX3513018.1 CU044_5270 family protein [Streptomyces caniscabiei]MDX3722056.1 CU044_5270 family protein [Streptomyces caniscabiei]MDX3732235.1 CU044_5270 family protein [Streptomyces caniscabiei]